MKKIPFLTPLYGAVLILEPESTDAELREDCRKMRELKMNTITVWPPVFYEKGEMRVDRNRRLMDIAADVGLGVIIELTGQVTNLEFLPDHAYRDELCVTNPDGSPAKMQNGLGEMNLNHPEVRTHLQNFLRFVVTGLKDHPALVGWDIWNETHFKSYDPWTVRAFQQWLEKRYGTVDALNAVWKKSYTAFEQIRLDPITWAAIAPDVDWEEFRTDNLRDMSADIAGWVREADPAHPIYADNVMSNTVWSEFDRGTDDWKLAKTVDGFGISFYPKTGGRLLRENAAWLRSLTFAGAAAAGGGRFVISEMQSHYYSEIFTTERVSPEDLIVWNLEALAQGSVGCIFWKWSPFTTGFQVGGRGLTLADGSFSRRAESAARLGDLFERHPALCGLKPIARAGLLYDRTNAFTVKTINNRIRHIIGDDQPARARFGLYRLCHERNLPLRIVTPDTLKADLLDLHTLFLPYQVTVDEASCQILRDFVERGGRLVANYPFCDIRSDGRLYRDLPGGPLNDLLGVRHEDNRVLNRSDVHAANGAPPLFPDTFEFQELRPSGALRARLTGDGSPLVFQRSVGKGSVWYSAFSVWNLAADHGHDAPGRWLLDQLVHDTPDMVPVTSDAPVSLASGPDADYLFVFRPDIATDCRVQCPEARPGAEWIFGEGRCVWNGGELDLGGAGAGIVRLPRRMR